MTMPRVEGVAHATSGAEDCGQSCGKVRSDINWTNWKRHINVCAKKKLKPNNTETSEAILKNTKTSYSRPEKKMSMYFKANVKIPQENVVSLLKTDDIKCDVAKLLLNATVVHAEDLENHINEDEYQLLAKYSPAISIHVSNLQISGRKELSFRSWQHSTFDISKREQVSFVIRYTKEEKVFERLISIKESIFTTGQALFDLFIKVMEYNHLDWKSYIVGQSYDGAASMQVETTRWMSQAYALTTVLETLDSILETLEDIKSLEGQVDFKTVFDFIEPVSRALQAHNIDILMAIKLIKKTEYSIKGLRSSDVFFNIYESVKKIAKDNNFEFELTLPTRRVRRVPRQSGELSNDKQINDPDLSLLTIKVISSTMKNKNIPVDAFSSICNNYNQILNKEDIVREYEQLVKSNINLISLDKNVSIVLNALSDESDSSSSTCSVDESESVNDSQSILKTYQIFINKGLLNIFPNLFTVLKIGVTLPIFSASPERTFSRLKLIKTRLRSTMIQDRLEDLMIISCESNIKTDTDKIIDNFAMRSSVLTKALPY
ncbi:zinc finger MYM-type protein 1-like [Aphis craccivora]|uniref:Zinc finger MYM-type protein 1-like n=1 Tax=Aphis craccivora TaxID=307492 RepID=A0A6G0Y0G4_APHCR|nr:zinc finger MYM-type protein 1-like [Aphis craccivora]